MPRIGKIELYTFLTGSNMNKLSKDITKTLLLKITLFFILWYVCVHSMDRHKPLPTETATHFLEAQHPSK